MKKIDMKDKLEDFGGKFYSGFLWLIQFIIMMMISYMSLMVVGIYGVQSIVLNLLKATDFGQGAVPTAVDVGLMVGLPAVFIAGFMFIMLFKFYKHVWAYFTRVFNKLRKKHIKSKGEE